MKEVINGKEYNTETATRIGKFIFENYSYEALYTCDKGFFLIWIGNLKYYGDDNKKITSVSFEEALDFLYETEQGKIAESYIQESC